MRGAHAATKVDRAGDSATDDHQSRQQDAAVSAAESDYLSFLDDLAVEQRSAPRRVTRIPGLLLRATRLVWQTSRAQTSVIMGAQFLMAAVSAVQVLLGGLAVRELLAVREGRSLWHVAVPVLLLAVVTTAGSLTGSGSSQFGRLLGVRVQQAVSARVLDVTTGVELVTYDDARFFDQLSRVLANVPTQPYEVVTSLASLVGGIAGVGALTITLLTIQPVLVLVVLLGGIPLWYFSRRGGRLEFNFAVSQTALIREREYLSQTLSEREAAAELRAYGTDAPLRARWNDLYEEFIAALRQQIRKRYLLNVLTGLATGIVTVATLIVLLLLIQHKSIGFGQAASAAVAIRLLSSRLQQLIGGLSTLFQAALFLDDYETFLYRIPAGGRSTPRAAAEREPFTGLSVTDVSFRYPNGVDDAITGVSLELRPNEIIALVGENGSGKTTLAKIMAGLYHPARGQLSLNGTLVRDDTKHRVREHVALVLQDFMHYALPASTNIAFGRPEADMAQDRIEEAAKRVGADGFLSSLPFGYDTRLSKLFRDGRELSLGQWQRVALARAFYRDAPIVILDEPTAALDPRAEAHLYDSVRSVLLGRTVVLITHRLASVRGADRIIVLDHGAIAEQGTHAELMSCRGLYAELVGLQRTRHIGSSDPGDDVAAEGDGAEGDGAEGDGADRLDDFTEELMVRDIRQDSQ